MLFPSYVKESTDSNGRLGVVSMLPLQLHCMSLVFFALKYRPVLAVACSRWYNSLVAPSIEPDKMARLSAQSASAMFIGGCLRLRLFLRVKPSSLERSNHALKT